MLPPAGTIAGMPSAKLLPTFMVKVLAAIAFPKVNEPEPPSIPPKRNRLSWTTKLVLIKTLAVGAVLAVLFIPIPGKDPLIGLVTI